ncbi:DUF4198 domain-containing protein [Roseibacterium sp. SDUM158017]|uniref:DUF4198 domain-containing protein n=1 Tax=Roseicyclus salinarum TaxID=3036773 RepID=UPI0024154781|nr:DUF4198 domain-containing protein [Roseibacterium sp. SDUM158017]MDG4649430.1 DUF4198 domain-containing protein [Roseibacterium sp. SDUM158017]
MPRFAVAATLALSIAAGPVLANEFWISPHAYRWPAEETLRADLRLGQRFMGASQEFARQEIERFEIITPEGAFDIEGENGDIPALSATGLPEGLAVIVHETTSYGLTWDDWPSFVAFAEENGLAAILAETTEAAQPADAPVREDCVRYAKSLVAVGHARGADVRVGMRAEFLALANPYTDSLASVLPVQFWLDDAPRRAVQVDVTARPVEGGDAVFERYETDGNGIVVLPVAAGMEYLVTSVILEPAAEGAAPGSHWRTLRASLTFEVPRPETTP